MYLVYMYMYRGTSLTRKHERERERERVREREKESTRVPWREAATDPGDPGESQHHMHL